jgi:hypothetical protein
MQNVGGTKPTRTTFFAGKLSRTAHAPDHRPSTFSVLNN